MLKPMTDARAHSVVSHDARTGAEIGRLPETDLAELDQMVSRAEDAAQVVAAASPARRRTWLRSIADALEASHDELVDIADRETALGRDRLSLEVSRTANQLRFYGDVAVEGSYLGVTIDEADGSKPRLVRVNMPLGPVAVFGASNFPLAFSVAGNDTASALAAGCPVIAKAHSAHPLLSLRVANIVTAALAAGGAPDGSFSLAVGRKAGRALVNSPEIRAVAFTGSQAGGLALWQLANDREQVIPVFAEMGTVNPVIVTELGAGDMAAVASGFVGSFTLGHGQYCTKPGLLFAPSGHGAPEAVAAALTMSDARPVMLTEQIGRSVASGISELEQAGAETVARIFNEQGGWAADAAVLSVPIALIRSGSRFVEECFGAVALVVEYDDLDQVRDVLTQLPGSLAATVISGHADRDPEVPQLVRQLSSKVGRVTVDDWPTGVAFSWAQHHGGPWPATSVPSATSVGAAALERFVRPVAFQSTPETALPEAARSSNPWRISRRVNGTLQAADATESS